MSNWKLIDVNGTVRDLETHFNFKVQFSPGAGMAPIENISTDFGNLPGGIYQGTRVPIRSFDLVGYISGSSVADLHAGRKALINNLKPNRTGSPTTVTIQYTGGACVLQASAVYDGGLEFGQSFSVYDEMEVNARFVQHNPFWELAQSSSQTLATTTLVANVSDIIQRDLTTGCWTSMASGVNNAVHTITVDQYTGDVYVGGEFNAAGSGTTAPFTACRIARWRPGTATWSSLSRGLGNSAADVCSGIALAPGGNPLYAVGTFTTAGSSLTTACRVAQCNISTCTWTAMAGGANASINAIAVAGDGLVYVGGGFTTIGGVTACYVAYWNPSTSAWSNMCMGTASGVTETPGAGAGIQVNSITLGLDGKVYVAGNFNQAGGISACRVAAWVPSSCTWEALGTGPDDEVMSVATGLDGRIYAVGAFDAANGQTTACRAIYWNGARWITMGNGLNAAPLHVFTTSSFIFSAGGTPKGITAPEQMGRFNDFTWSPIPVDLPAIANVFAIDVNTASNVMTIGFSSTTGTASTPGVTVVTNSGTADAYPIFSASGPGRIYEFRNFTTGTEIFFDNLTLNAGEVATLDLRPGKKTFTSNHRGNIVSKIQPGSDVTGWRLLSGSNAVSVFISGCTTAPAARLIWTPRYWGIDS